MSSIVLDKFRGTLVGALVGDCIGSSFDFLPHGMRKKVNQFFDTYEKRGTKKKILMYTDDSEMTIGIAESLYKFRAFEPVDMARRFVDNFYTFGRSYGLNVENVFEALSQTNFTGDVFRHAEIQFGGSGSWGNGGAMRISPVPLFCCSDYSLMLQMVEKCTKLTHTHELAINGALLQAICVFKCLNHDPKQAINVDNFIEDIITKMLALETVDETRETYNSQLKNVQMLLKKNASDDEVVECLGNGMDISAIHSVPTALYCFLRAQKPIQNLETENLFRRTVSYAASLGGDADTISSMAGAMCGAYVGFSCINKELRERCEGLHEMIDLADGLYSLHFVSSSGSNH